MTATNDQPAPPAAGLPKCPRCAGADWGVLKTRREVGRIVRIRVCRGCRLRIRTGERVEFTPPLPAPPADAATEFDAGQQVR